MYRSTFFLTSTLVGGERSASRLYCFTPGEIADRTHCRGGSLEDVERRNPLTIPGLELPTLGRLARSQSLYRLRYPASVCLPYKSKILYVRKWSKLMLCVLQVKIFMCLVKHHLVRKYGGVEVYSQQS
jgi:hypothetical protein